MKKFLVLFFIIFPITTFARKAGNVILSIYGGGGISINGGSPPTKSDMGYMSLNDMGDSGYSAEDAFTDEEIKAKGSFNLGIGISIFISPVTSFFVSGSYEVKENKIYYPKKDASQDLEISLKTKFITLSVVLRNYVSDSFFIGLGGFYALKTSTWPIEMIYGSNVMADDVENLDGTGSYNAFGFIFELGYSIDISKKISLDIIAKTSWGLETFFEQQDNRGDDFAMQTRSIELVFSGNYHF